jgi:hypothetical protein
MLNIGKVKLNKTINQNGFFVNKAFYKGEIICSFSHRAILATPTYLTIQLNDDVHILLSPIELENINHSCNPNVFFNTDTMQLIAIRPICDGDELCFFYPSTEWKMDQPFVCKCGSSACLLTIQGAYYLTANERKRYQFTKFIQQKLTALDFLQSA